MNEKKIAFIDAPRSQEYWGNDMAGRAENLLISELLSQMNIHVDIVPWYEDNNWNQYSQLIVRSPSDIYFHIDEFNGWLDSIENLQVLNGIDVIRWNMDKQYLGEIKPLGINVAETQFVKPGSTFISLEDEFVVKPVTSGGGANSGRFLPSQLDEAQKLVDRIHELGQTAIVQPYLKSVDERGEIDLIFYNENFDHAIIKGAVLSKEKDKDIPEVSHPNPQPYFPTEEELDLAYRAIQATPRSEKLLYARIDMATDNDGNPSIMELEYIDPVLFLNTSEGSDKRFAEAIASRIN